MHTHSAIDCIGAIALGYWLIIAFVYIKPLVMWSVDRLKAHQLRGCIRKAHA